MAGIFFRRIFGQYRYYIVILLGVAVGSLMANLVIDDITDKIGMFNEDFNNAIISVSLDKTLYLRYILKLRLKEYICFMLVLFTPGCYSRNIYIYAFCRDKFRSYDKRMHYEYGDKRNVYICSMPYTAVYNICNCRFFNGVIY